MSHRAALYSCVHIHTGPNTPDRQHQHMPIPLPLPRATPTHPLARKEPQSDSIKSSKILQSGTTARPNYASRDCSNHTA
ncbi:hypothetical protein IQ07DRAFT_582378 [Pyrenochaeta sp. DS3sAY3a]|nr:hypothetical protein IQ07DRAFT_582378 [Pyrenochaeta sp. DS3sAY3a]